MIKIESALSLLRKFVPDSNGRGDAGAGLRHRFLGQRFLCYFIVRPEKGARLPDISPKQRLQWELENPALAPDHNGAVRRVRDQLRHRIVQFVREQQ